MDSFFGMVARSPLRYAFFGLIATSFAELVAPRSLISASEKKCVGVMHGVREWCVFSVSASFCMCMKPVLSVTQDQRRGRNRCLTLCAVCACALAFKQWILLFKMVQKSFKIVLRGFS